MSRLTLATTIVPNRPGSGDVLRYYDKNGIQHTLDENGVDTVVSGRAWYNWVINSGFWLAQRQAPATLTTYDSAATRKITADRWAVNNETASIQYQRTDTIGAPETGLTARYYGSYSKITNQGKIAISQMVAGNETEQLRNRTVRIQATLKSIGTPPGVQGFVWRLGLVSLTSSAANSNTTGATYISAYNGAGIDPTLGANLEYVQPLPGQTGDNCVLRSNGVDCFTTTTWQKFGALFQVPISTRNLLVMLWSDDQVRVGNGISVSEFIMTDGNEPQIWAPEDLTTEILRVQRYYVKTFAIDTLPAQNVGLNTGHLDWIAGKAAATALAAQWSWRLPARLAQSGTVTTYNPAAANAEGRDVGAGADLSATASVTGVGLDVIRITSTGNAGTAVGNQVSVHATCDAEFV